MTYTPASAIVLPALLAFTCGLVPFTASPVTASPVTASSVTASSVGPMPGLPVSDAHTVPRIQHSGDGVWPLGGEVDVVRPFEPPDTRWTAGHRGVDLAGFAAQAVAASLPGEVSFAGFVAGRPVVVVRHGDTRTTYEPVRAEVAVGDLVERGARLGWLQPGGSHCAPAACLHWGWRRGETYLDPLDLVGGAGVRLLPLWSTPQAQPSATDQLAPHETKTPSASLAARPAPWWPLMPWGEPAGRPF